MDKEWALAEDASIGAPYFDATRPIQLGSKSSYSPHQRDCIRWRMDIMLSLDRSF